MAKKKSDNAGLKAQLSDIVASSVGFDYPAILGILAGYSMPDALSWLVEVFEIRLPVGSSAQDAKWFFYGPTSCKWKVSFIEEADSTAHFACRTYLKENFPIVRDLLIQLGFDAMESGDSEDRSYQVLHSKELGFTIHLSWRKTVPEDPQREESSGNPDSDDDE